MRFFRAIKTLGTETTAIVVADVALSSSSLASDIAVSSEYFTRTDEDFVRMTESEGKREGAFYTQN